MEAGRERGEEEVGGIFFFQVTGQKIMRGSTTSRLFLAGFPSSSRQTSVLTLKITVINTFPLKRRTEM